MIRGRPTIILKRPTRGGMADPVVCSRAVRLAILVTLARSGPSNHRQKSDSVDISSKEWSTVLFVPEFSLKWAKDLHKRIHADVVARRGEEIVSFIEDNQREEEKDPHIANNKPWADITSIVDECSVCSAGKARSIPGV